MNKYTSIVIDNLNQITNKDIKDWNNLASSIFTKYDFIKIFEDEKIINIKPKHILIYDSKKKLVGLAIFYIEYEAVHATFEDNIYGKYSQFLNKFIPLKPSLVCYIPEGISFQAIEATENNEIIYEKIIDTMSNIAKKEKIKQYAIYYIKEDAKNLIKVLNKKKFNKVFSSFASYIDIEWDSFVDYIKSTSRPKKIKREIKKNKEMNVKIEELNFNSPYLSVVTSAINENLNKYSKNPIKIPETLLKKLLKKFPQEVKIYKVTLQNQIISGMICIKEKNFFYNGKGGQLNVDIKNYSFFESAIYTPIRIAIKEKIPKIYLGTHAYQYKKERGAKTYPLYIYVKSNNKTRNFILKYLLLIVNKYKYNKHNKILNENSQKNK